MAATFNPLRPWRHPLRLWRVGCYNATGLPVATIAFVVIVVMAAVTIATLPTFVFAVPLAFVTLLLSRLFGHIERNRVAALAGVSISDPVTKPTAPTRWGRLKQRLRSGPRYRELAHHIVGFPAAVIGFAVTFVAWSASWAMLTLPAYLNALPEDTAKFHFFEVELGWRAVGAAAVGWFGVVFLSPWLTIASARMQVALARALLGPTAEEEHRTEVARLETQRGAAVDSAESERRRIERDLHDGAQQRLVALAAGLGAAKEKLEVDPDEGRRMVAEAHDEAKAALKEIRDLVRGIHPVILEDRGLDAALSAVVARSPIPVVLDVQLAGRLPPAVESAAYFVVTEALTNVAKHAGATRAHVSIARAAGRLVVEIRDNGVGGADPERGSGLRGLRHRVNGLGGALYVVSPPGGPTTISVEVPCGS